MGEDPAFYKKFSKMLEDVIEEYTLKRLSDAEYLKKVTEIMESVRDRKDDDIPKELVNNDNAQAFFRQSKETLKGNLSDEALKQVPIELAIKIENIIKSNIIVDWKTKPDIINKMK